MTAEHDARPVPFVPPEPNSPLCPIELRRQSLALREDPAESEILDWIAQVADTRGWR